MVALDLRNPLGHEALACNGNAGDTAGWHELEHQGLHAACRQL